MKNKQTLLTIAEDLNLSKSTVAACLSGKAEKYKIKPETIARVKKYSEQTGYIPNRIARSLTKPGESPIGLIISQSSSSEKSMYAMHEAMQMLEQSGREFIVQNFLVNHISDTVYALKGMNVKHIIMFGMFSEHINPEREPKDELGRFIADRGRLVSLLEDINFYSVDYDFPIPANSPLKIYRMGVRRGDIYARMFELLQKAGKIPIACNENCLASPEFRMNLEHLELKIIPEHIITMPDRAKNLFTIGNSLTPQVIDMIKNGRIKTVALHDDKVAAGLINGLLEKGYSVPDDISVIGFDNIDASAYFKIPLTTIELPILNNTVMAVESILSGKDIPMHIESAGKIIWRESAKI